MKCAECEDRECGKGKNCTNIKEEVKAKYIDEDFKIMKAAGLTTSQFYMQKTRLEEILYFSQEMDYQRLGLAFCIGLQKEAEIINKILSKEFKVFSACCKICGMDKLEFGLGKQKKENKPNVTCNPIGQATILNHKNTQLNIILGLCLGHDILFTKHSEAPVTTLVVKDRVLAHNPLGAIYSGYYLKKYELN